MRRITYDIRPTISQFASCPPQTGRPVAGFTCSRLDYMGHECLDAIVPQTSQS